MKCKGKMRCFCINSSVHPHACSRDNRIDNARDFMYNALVFKTKRKNHDNFSYNSNG